MMGFEYFGKRSLVVLVLVFLQGCVTTYVAKPDEPMVTVHTVGFGSPQICKDGKYYWASPHKSIEGAISVPATGRITVGAHLVSGGYQVIHYCRPFLSFQPSTGFSYFMNSVLIGDGRCSVELVREDIGSPNGFAVEPSVARSTCEAAK